MEVGQGQILADFRRNIKSSSRSRSGSSKSTKRDKIRCFTYKNLITFPGIVKTSKQQTVVS